MSDAYPGNLKQLLTDMNVVAIVATQRLRPIDGPDAPFFPPTYLGSNDEPTYCISPLGDGKNLCVIDSVQSQANRLEAAFLLAPYRALIRKVEVTAKLANSESRTLDMLQLGHRIADAAVSFSTLAEQSQAAIRSFATGPDDIAKLSPMSLLCGMWDSRRSQIKIPRAFSATITARNVHPLSRNATFTGSFWSKELGLDGKRSAEGLDPVPASEALGGVIAEGNIMRTATLNLIALRQNCKVKDEASVGPAASYIFGLGLVAMTMQPEAFLRQGCLLVTNGAYDMRVVMRSGDEKLFALDHEAAIEVAKKAAEDFGVPVLEPISAVFQAEKVEVATPVKDKPARGK